MNKFEELKFNVDALFHAAGNDQKFFSPIYNFVENLRLQKALKTQRLIK